MQLLQRSVHDPYVSDDAAERIKDRVEDKGLERCFGITTRGGDTLYDGLHDVWNTDSGLAGGFDDVFAFTAGKFDHLIGHFFNAGRLHVYFIEHGDDLQVVLQGQEQVRDRLRLDALGGVYQQQRTLTGGDGAGNLVAKIHVAGGVDHIEDVLGPVRMRVTHLNGVALDGDAALAL